MNPSLHSLTRALDMKISTSSMRPRTFENSANILADLSSFLMTLLQVQKLMKHEYFESIQKGKRLLNHFFTKSYQKRMLINIKFIATKTPTVG